VRRKKNVEDFCVSTHEIATAGLRIDPCNGIEDIPVMSSHHLSGKMKGPGIDVRAMQFTIISKWIVDSFPHCGR